MNYRRHLSPHNKPRRRDTDNTSRRRSPYRPPRLVDHGRLGALVRGASWKGIDSIGELDPEQGYPG